MAVSPSLRRLALTAHIATSVGWLGAVAVFCVVAFVALGHSDAATVRGAYLVMEPAAHLALVPLALASLATGLVSALASPWGLLRHYWVVFKLLINLFATAVLVVYLDTFSAMARLAADPTVALAAVRNPSPLLHAALALAILGVALVLAVYKPRGLTPWGRRANRLTRARRESTRSAD